MISSLSHRDLYPKGHVGLLRRISSRRDSWKILPSIVIFLIKSREYQVDFPFLKYISSQKQIKFKINLNQVKDVKDNISLFSKNNQSGKTTSVNPSHFIISSSKFLRIIIKQHSFHILIPFWFGEFFIEI